MGHQNFCSSIANSNAQWQKEVFTPLETFVAVIKEIRAEVGLSLLDYKTSRVSNITQLSWKTKGTLAEDDEPAGTGPVCKSTSLSTYHHH